MKVNELYTRNPVTARPDDTVLHAAHLMRSEHVGDVIVVDEKKGVRLPVGILTDRDIVLELLRQDTSSLEQLTVRDAMTEIVILAEEDDDVDAVLSNMRANGIRRLPVVDAHGGLTGILTYDDLVRRFARQLGALAAIVGNEIARERREPETRAPEPRPAGPTGR